MKHQPTPQPSGRTAEEILDEHEFKVTNVPKHWEKTDERKSLDNELLHELFDAICSEVIGEDEEPKYGIATLGDEARVTGNVSAVKNSINSELREKLRIFFNQSKQKL
jgi:hypothetical protein